MRGRGQPVHPDLPDPLIAALASHRPGPAGGTRRSTPRIEGGEPALVLAPMEGVTDAPMRALLSELGGFSLCVTEFLRVSHGVPGPRVFRAHVPELVRGCRTPAGVPVQV